MTEGTVIMTALIGFASGGMAVGMWLWHAVSRVRTERDWQRSEASYFRESSAILASQRDRHRSDAEAMTDKIATLTSDCLEFQRLAHKAQDGLDMAKGMLAGEMAAHATTKRQLAAAKGQITKLKRRIEG